jgi:hypothetical protein
MMCSQHCATIAVACRNKRHREQWFRMKKEKTEENEAATFGYPRERVF